MKSKLLMSVGVGILLTVGTFSTVFAATSPSTNTPGLPQSGVSLLDNGSTVYYGTDAVSYAKQHNLKTTGKIVEVVHVVNSQSISSGGQVSPNTVSPNWGGSGTPYITDLQPTGWDGTSPIGSTSINGPAPLTLSINEGESATWSATGGVSASVVSASVGFSVTQSYNVTATGGPVNVPSGHRWSMVAYPTYSGDDFQVWVNPFIGSAYQAGSGYAGKPIGADFVVSQVY